MRGVRHPVLVRAQGDRLSAALLRAAVIVRVVEGLGISARIGSCDAQGRVFVVTAMDERTVVVRSRAGRYRLGAWSNGHQRHPAVGVGSWLIVVLTSARQGPTMVRAQLLRGHRRALRA